MVFVRRYQVYLIKEQYVSQYIGREFLFLGLFKDFMNSRGTQSRVLGRQIVYITNEIPIKALYAQFEKDLYLNSNVKLDNGIFYIKQKDKHFLYKSSARLEIRNRVIHIQSEGSYDAESIFFECIRKVSNQFLAIDLEHEVYGWLKPIKERKLI